MRHIIFAILLAAVAQAAPRPTPEALYRQAISDPELLKNGFGEGFCWHGRYHQRTFLTAYEVWNDTAWLDWGVKYYEFLLDKMQTGPDGYRGWIGPYMYDNSFWCDVHVGDAILLDGMLEFAEVVLKDKALAARYGDKARNYVAIARRDLFDKWDARGTWREDGPFGAYRSWNRYGEPGNLKAWPVRNEVRGSNLALPFNKQNDMATVALKLYRITGEDKFRRRAERIFSYHKSRFQYSGEAVFWNYWEPYGPEDVEVEAGRTRHWVGVHPYRNYQAGEVSQIVEAYHTGVVFDRRDIERALHTNLKIMWNGDRERPAFRNSDATLPRPQPPERKVTAGALWTALAEFDQTVRDLAGVQRSRGSDASAEIARARAAEAGQTPPGFARKYAALPARPVAFPVHDCLEINMAAALPSDFTAANGTLLAASLLTPAELEVAVYSADGAKKLRELSREKREPGLVLVKWDGAGAAKGPHRIRWTVDGKSYREFPVTVR